MGDHPRVAMTLTQAWHEVPGGTAAAAESLAEALLRADVEVTGVVPAGRLPRGHPALPVPTSSLRLPVPWLYDAWHLLRRPRVTSAVGGADLVHLTMPICCPPEQVPMVATVHDVLPLTMPEMFTRRGVRLMTRGLARIRAEAARVMVPSEHGVDEFVRQGFDRDRLVVVPLGVDPVARPARPEVDSVVHRHGLEPPYVLFVGTAEPRKGLDVLLAALEQMDRPEVSLAVAGPTGWGDALGPAAARLGGRVKVLGRVPGPDLPALRAGAAVCCLPSRAEGFGLPVLEAMAVGAPVVTTSGTPMEEFAGPAALYAAPGDARGLCSALTAVIDDPALAERLGAEGLRRSSALTWDAAAQRVADVYAEVLS